MAKPEKIGLIGPGLMGHGIGKNLLAKGYALTVMGHRNRAPVEDLLAKGAKEAKSPRDLAAASDIVFTVVGNSPQLEDLVFRDDGILAGLKPGAIMADCTTAMPESSVKIAAAVKAKGGRFVDTPMTRTPNEAEAGTLCLMTGGDEATLAEIRPVLECFANLIVHCGGVGAGHAVKLVNNMIALGTAAVVAEGFVAAAKSGIDLKALREVISGGGANSVMFQRFASYVVDGDGGTARFAMANASKDLRYFTHMVEALPMAAPMAQATHQQLLMANAMGMGDEYILKLVDVAKKVNEKK
jgi:3-hydroxyisobutyrate dehydrogenase-like beta-hydroxyacid dehydrogenase